MSEQSRSPSPSPSEVPQPHRSIASRIATYPKSWTHEGLSPQLLASCGLCYYPEFDEDACICHECKHYATIPILTLDKVIELTTFSAVMLSLASWLTRY